jgi:prepilin-type N-terminal cleavage/methylation domain-containing protein
MVQRRANSQTRAGFTLLELLVVLFLITFISGLAMGVYTRVRRAQETKVCNESLTKLEQGMKLQWKSILDLARKEQIPPVTVYIAGGNQDRARALHMKLRLRQEFPQTFAEAMNAPSSPAADATFASTYGAGLTVNQALQQAYTPRKAFSDGINKIGTPVVIAAVPIDVQHATMLMMNISQMRGGSVFDAEKGLGGSATRETVVGGTSFKLFYDPWDRLLKFERVSGDATIAAELSAPPYIPATASSGDPTDPLGTFFLAAKYPWPVLLRTHATSALNEPLDGQNRGYVIYSGGPRAGYNNGDEIYAHRIAGTGKGE